MAMNYNIIINLQTQISRCYKGAGDGDGDGYDR